VGKAKVVDRQDVDAWIEAQKKLEQLRKRRPSPMLRRKHSLTEWKKTFNPNFTLSQ
jgi:hypothetical protein